MQKVVPGFRMDDAPALLTEQLAEQVRGLMEKYGMGCAVLGCYLNLAVPDEERYQHTVEIYKAHLRFAKWIGADTVGTETGCPNMGYKTEPACWTEETLQLLIRRMAPVVEEAEALGQVFAIEPVWRHIVNTPERAQQVLKAYEGTEQLRIIFDAVNLLNAANCRQADAVVEDGLNRLGSRISVLHLKDWTEIPGSDDVKSVACGLGHMTYERLLRFAALHPGIPMTLENTSPDNAEAARKMLERLAES